MLVGFLRVLQCLPRQLLPAQVISFSMLGRGGPVGMGGNFVKFSGSLMGIARHTLPLHKLELHLQFDTWVRMISCGLRTRLRAVQLIATIFECGFRYNLNAPLQPPPKTGATAYGTAVTSSSALIAFLRP
jgi:hypothetical protein